MTENNDLVDHVLDRRVNIPDIHTNPIVKTTEAVAPRRSSAEIVTYNIEYI